MTVFFNATGKICGCDIKSYLLEKIRVCAPSQGERNFHIFYQLCKACHLCDAVFWNIIFTLFCFMT